MPRPLTNRDTSEQVALIRLALLVGVPLEYMCISAAGMLPQSMYWWMILLIGPLCIGLVVMVIWSMLNAGSHGLINMMSASSSLSHTADYSLQDAMIIRGETDLAVKSFRDLIAERPVDVAARMRLGALLERLGDHAAAEQCYLDVRVIALSADQDWALANALIDLYRRTGQRDKFKYELARFARTFEHTRGGKDARTELRMLVRDEEQ